MRKRKICKGDDCFSAIDYEYDVTIMADGTPHPLSLKCYKCQTNEDGKKIKAYKKRQRHKKNKREEKFKKTYKVTFKN